MALHMRPKNPHFRFCQNRCALRVVFILKRTVAYVLGHFGAIFGHLKIIRFGWFFYWSTIVTHTFTIPNFMTLLFQEVGGLAQKCPKMAVFCSFFGAVHILNRHRALGVAPLNSPCFFKLIRVFPARAYFFFLDRSSTYSCDGLVPFPLLQSSF